MKKLITVVLMVTLIISSLAGCSNNSEKKNGKSMEYEGKLMDDSTVHTINVEISDEDWNDLLKNPLDKTKYKVDVDRKSVV